MQKFRLLPGLVWLMLSAFGNVQGQAPAAGVLSLSHGTLNITTPVPRIVYQRNHENQAVIPITGICSAAADRIETRLVARGEGQGTTTPWKLIQPAGSNGLVHGSVFARGGWYNLEVRALAGSTMVASTVVERVGVGEVFVVVGHSVAAGQDLNIEGADDDRVSTVPLNKNTETYQIYLRTGDPRYLPTPVFGHYGSGVIPAPFGSGNYFWAKFAEQVVRKQNVPVLLYNAAFGGTSLEHWAKSAQGIQFPHSFVKASIRMPYINLLNTFKQYIPLTGLRAVLADQGQNDWPEKDGELVFSHYTAWVEQARHDLAFPDLAIVVNRQTPFLRDQQIRQVQERLIGLPNCFPGPDYDRLPADARPDAIHLGLKGQAQAATMWAEAIESRFFNVSRPWLPDFK